MGRRGGSSSIGERAFAAGGASAVRGKAGRAKPSSSSMRERASAVVWAFGMAWRINGRLLAVMLALVVALSVLPAISLSFNRAAIAQLSTYIATGAGSFDEVLPVLVRYGLILAFITLSTRVNSDFIGTLMTNAYGYGMQEHLMDAIHRSDVLTLMRRNVNEDFNYIVRQSQALTRLISSICAIGGKVASIVSLLAVAWTLSRPVFFITAVYVVAVVGLSATFSKGTRFSYPVFRKAEVKAQFLQNMPAESNIAKEVRVYGCADAVVSSWRAAFDERMNLALARIKSTEVRSFVMGAVFYAFLAVVMVYLLALLAQARSAPDVFLTTFTLCTSLFATMSTLTRDLINFDESLFAMEQQRGLLKGAQAVESAAGAEGARAAEGAAGAEEPRVAEGARIAEEVRVAEGTEGARIAEGAPEEPAVEQAAEGMSEEPAVGRAADGAANASSPSPALGESDIVFSARDMVFSYNGRKRDLDGVTLDVRRGEVVALIGENGSGKSTLVKLLIGVFAPDSGTLLFNGQPYSAYAPDVISKRIGVFFQDFYLFHHTLGENIAYGNVESMGRDDEVWEAVRRGGATRVVEKLPQGLGTLVRKRIDKDGVEFSGGEKQLVATARAYMGDKDVLVFDEPASMLDPLAEIDQFRAIRSRIGGKTGILISHRVGFARLADRIVMMDAGRVAEAGTHEELMAKDGLYARFFREQARWYEQAGDLR